MKLFYNVYTVLLDGTRMYLGQIKVKTKNQAKVKAQKIYGEDIFIKQVLKLHPRRRRVGFWICIVVGCLLGNLSIFLYKMIIDIGVTTMEQVMSILKVLSF